MSVKKLLKMAGVNFQTDTDLTLFNNEFDYNVEETRLRTYYNELLSEAFEFYDTNEKIWKDYKHDLLYDLLEDKEFHHFTMSIREAVVTMVYIYRSEYHNYFIKDIRDRGCIAGFIPSFVCYHFRLKMGFSDFFHWIAYLFELKLFCKIHKIEFEEMCIKHFVNQLGFHSYKACVLHGLQKACSPFHSIYSSLVQTFKGSYPSFDILLPFFNAKRIVNREFMYDKKWVYFALFRNSVDQTKFNALSSYMPKRIVQGYKSRNKFIAQDESKAFSKESKETDENLHLAERTQECTEVSLDASSRKFNRSKKSRVRFDKTKSFFAISERYLAKHVEGLMIANVSEYKRYIKLYSTANGKMELFEGLMNVLDESLRKDTLYEIADKVFAVQPSNSDVNLGDKIIILDTSSDDEEELPDPPQQVLVSSLIPALKYWKYCIASKTEYLKEVYEFREKLKYNAKCKLRNDKEKEVTTNGTGTRRKEIEPTEQNLAVGKKKNRARKKNFTGQNFQTSDTLMLNDCKEDNSMLNTGAIPKINKSKGLYKNSSKQSLDKSKGASVNIRPPTDDELMMDAILEQLEKIKLCLENSGV